MTNLDFDINGISRLSYNEKNLRKKNLELFFKTGFPNKNKEDWKFSDLDKILKKNFKNITNKVSFKLNSKVKKIDAFEHNFVVLTNGMLTSSDFSHEDKDKIKIENTNYVEFKKDKSNSLTLLNNALSLGGYSIEISEEYKFNKPLVVYNYFSENLHESLLNNKNVIKLNKNSNMTIVELTEDYTKNNFFKNTFELIEVDNNASLIYFSLQKSKSNGHFYKKINANLNHNAKYQNYILTSGLKFNKSEIEIDLNKDTSNCSIFSALYLSENEHQEIKTKINHQAYNCKSFQKIKNVLNKNGRGVYQGKIFVKDIAQKTDAYQLSKALILDDNSEFNAKPELEIYADDVKCSHGSTSGSIDSEAIHYLMTRGLNENDAKKLLIKGFLNDIFDNIQDKQIFKFVQKILGDQINGY